MVTYSFFFRFNLISLPRIFYVNGKDGDELVIYGGRLYLGSESRHIDKFNLHQGYVVPKEQ